MLNHKHISDLKRLMLKSALLNKTFFIEAINTKINQIKEQKFYNLPKYD